MRDLQQMCLCAVVLKNGSTGSPNRKGSDGGVHHDLQRSNKLHEKHKQWLQWKRLIALTASAFACCHFASAEGWSAQTARTRVARTNWLFYIFFNHFISIPVYFISFCINHAWRISEADSPRLQGKLEAWQRWSPYTERPRPPLWSAPAGHHGNRWDTSLQELRERHFINLVTDNVLKDKAAYTRRRSGSGQRNRTHLQFFWLMKNQLQTFHRLQSILSFTMNVIFFLNHWTKLNWRWS